MPDTSGVHLWLILMKAYHALDRHAERDIAGSGLGMSDFRVLEALLHKGPLPVNTIGVQIWLTSGSATAAIDRLEKKGLVRRANDSSDRRARIVHLTPAGRALIERVFAKHRDVMERAAAGLDASEREQLLALLKKLGKSA
jgi:MarR family 2-MHQ and catechol resistance regulon transcriptional repressor